MEKNLQSKKEGGVGCRSHETNPLWGGQRAPYSKSSNNGRKDGWPLKHNHCNGCKEGSQDGGTKGNGDNL